MLRSFRQISDDVEISIGFITHSEYQLYLDERREQGIHRQPDYWTAYDFFEAVGKDAAQQPVIGVQAADAQDFCEWLSEKSSIRSWRYRLPTSSETNAYPPETNDIGAWYQNEGVFRLTQLPTEKEKGLIQGLKGYEDSNDLKERFDLDIYHNHAQHLGAYSKDHPAVNSEFNSAIDTALNLERQRASRRYIYKMLPGATADEGSAGIDTMIANLPVEISLMLDHARAISNDRVLPEIGRLDVAVAVNDAQRLVRSLNFCLIANPDNGKTTEYINVSLAKNDTRKAIESARYVSNSSYTSASDRLIADLIIELLQIIAALKWELVRLHSCRFRAKVCAIASLGAPVQEEKKGWRKRFGFETKSNKTISLKQNLIDEYWYAQSIAARQEGRLLPWEGIRLIRERAN